MFMMDCCARCTFTKYFHTINNVWNLCAVIGSDFRVGCTSYTGVSTNLIWKELYIKQNVLNIVFIIFRIMHREGWQQPLPRRLWRFIVTLQPGNSSSAGNERRLFVNNRQRYSNASSCCDAASWMCILLLALRFDKILMSWCGILSKRSHVHLEVALQHIGKPWLALFLRCGRLAS